MHPTDSILLDSQEGFTTDADRVHWKGRIFHSGSAIEFNFVTYSLSQGHRIVNCAVRFRRLGLCKFELLRVSSRS